MEAPKPCINRKCPGSVSLKSLLLNAIKVYFCTSCFIVYYNENNPQCHLCSFIPRSKKDDKFKNLQEHYSRGKCEGILKTGRRFKLLKYKIKKIATNGQLLARSRIKKKELIRLNTITRSLESIAEIGPGEYKIIDCFKVTKDNVQEFRNKLNSKKGEWNPISKDVNRKSVRSWVKLDTPCFLEEVETLIRNKFPDRKIMLTALKIGAHNLPQILHVDHPSFKAYTNKINNNIVSKKDIPYGALIAIEENTHLWIYHPDSHLLHKVHVPVGSIIVFAGDVIHAGGSYKTDHFRIHMYIDSDFSDLTRRNHYFNKIQQQPILYELANDEKWTCDKFHKAYNLEKWQSCLQYHDIDIIENVLKLRDKIIAKMEYTDQCQAQIFAKLTLDTFRQQEAEQAESTTTKSIHIYDQPRGMRWRHCDGRTEEPEEPTRKRLKR